MSIFEFPTRRISDTNLCKVVSNRNAQSRARKSIAFKA
jgi:hypothetical protein